MAVRNRSGGVGEERLAACLQHYWDCVIVSELVNAHPTLFALPFSHSGFMQCRT